MRPDFPNPASPDLVRESTGVDADAGTRELEALTEALQGLPEQCRQVLTLRKVYGLSQREIAVRLGVTETAIEMLVAEGLRRCSHVFSRKGLP